MTRIVLRMPPRWRAWLWQLTSAPARRRARRAWTRSMEPDVMHQRVEQMRDLLR